jgi:hypothetical protein
MSREHARPQPPAGRQPPVRRRGGQRSQPRCRSGSPATEPSGPGPKLDPPDHTQPNPDPHWTQGANGGQYRRLWPLIAQLVLASGISRRKGHKNASFGPFKKKQPGAAFLRYFYATMAAISSNGPRQAASSKQLLPQPSAAQCRSARPSAPPAEPPAPSPLSPKPSASSLLQFFSSQCAASSRQQRLVPP